MSRVFEYAAHAVQKADEMAKRLHKPYAILKHSRGFEVIQVAKVVELDRVLEVCKPSKKPFVPY